MSKEIAKKKSNGANVGFEETLWSTADKMRNNMDPAEYKHVVLGLIFLKYISDSFGEVYKSIKADADYYDGQEEDKDVAKELRVSKIMPALAEGKTVVLNFSGVSGTTQSFIHALISEPIRQFRDVTLEKIEYKDCSDVVKEVIKIVYEYMQESIDSE